MQLLKSLFGDADSTVVSTAINFSMSRIVPKIVEVDDPDIAFTLLYH